MMINRSKTINNLRTLNFEALFHKLTILISLGVIGNLIFSYFSSDLDILDKLINFSPLYFILAMIMALIPWLTHALRISIWTRFIGKKLPANGVFKTVLTTDLGSAITPSAIGGGMSK